MKHGHANLLSIISDGNFHSGEELASQLNVSRAAVWKSIKQLESWGLQIEAIRGKGYRSFQKIELLSENKIRSYLSPVAQTCCSDLAVLFKTGSSNTVLLDQLNNDSTHGKVVFAEYQSGGRGRRGNQWFSPIASGICFSLAWRFDATADALSALSLKVGVAVVRSLKQTGIEGLRLKWPNDILIQKQKLGGILLELRGEAGGPVDVIIGIGLNYDFPERLLGNIDQATTDLCKNTDRNLSRNRLAAEVLSGLFQVLLEINEENDVELINEWRQYACYLDESVTLTLPDKKIEGVFKDVDSQGALLLSIDGQLRRFASGEISLRPQ